MGIVESVVQTYYTVKNVLCPDLDLQEFKGFGRSTTYFTTCQKLRQEANRSGASHTLKSNQSDTGIQLRFNRQQVQFFLKQSNMVKFSEAIDNPGCKVLDCLELEEIIFKKSQTVFLLSKLMCYSLWKDFCASCIAQAKLIFISLQTWRQLLIRL